MRDQWLLLIGCTTSKMSVQDLKKWTEYSNDTFIFQTLTGFHKTPASLSETKSKFKRSVRDRYGQKSLDLPNQSENCSGRTPTTAKNYRWIL